MFRKLSLVAIAAASLAPTAATAWDGGHGGWHRWGGPRIVIGGPGYRRGHSYGGCYVRRLVATPWGVQWRLVNRSR